MWPFNRKPNIYEESTNQVVDKALNDFDCHIHQNAYVSCIQQKRLSYHKCLELMEIYNYCLASTAFRHKKPEKPL